MKHYEEQIRRSVKKDFDNAYFKTRREKPKRGYKIIERIKIDTYYYDLRRFFIGKAVKIIRNSENGEWVEFVNESDRTALNKYAGWSEKKTYLINAIYQDV